MSGDFLCCGFTLLFILALLLCATLMSIGIYQTFFSPNKEYYREKHNSEHPFVKAGGALALGFGIVYGLLSLFDRKGTD